MSSRTPTMSSSTAERELSVPVIPLGQTAPGTGAASVVIQPTVWEPQRSLVVSWIVRMAQFADTLWLRAFTAAAPLNGRTTGRLVTKTLRGLERCSDWMPGQHYGILAEHARLQLELVLNARWNRHRQFLSVRAAMSRNQTSFSPTNSDLYLNPASKWVRFQEKSIPEDHSELSSDILFFYLDREIRGARMNLECQVLINELADYQPCTVAQWARCSSFANSRQLTRLVSHLQEMGLVAWRDRSPPHTHETRE